jgi:hypothetical protein
LVADLLHSDGQTSEELTKQVLSIAAILPGQQPTRRFSIPERSSLNTSRADSQKPEVTSEQQQEQQHEANGDLIDLQSDPIPRPVTVGAEQQGVPAIQKSPPGEVKPAELKQMTNLEKMAEGVQNLTVNEDTPTKVSSIKESAQSPPLRRMDSESQGVDEFHDAES